MCRNIRPLHNYDPPTTEHEVRDASLQYVRKISGMTKPSKANEEAFARAVEAVTAASARLLSELVTNAPPPATASAAPPDRAVAERMLVEIWSDLVCPWCYLGKRRLERALEGFEHADRVDVVWRSFELEPDAPKVAESRRTLLLSRYGMTAAQAAERDAQMTALAEAEGLEYRPDLAQIGNTFDAHRVLHAARAAGVQGEAKERLLRGYFTEGRKLTDADTLVELAADAGLDPAAARAALADDGVADEVRGDEREAAAIGITGVPFFVLNRRYAVSGAQPSEILLGALERTWAETVEGAEPPAS